MSAAAATASAAASSSQPAKSGTAGFGKLLAHSEKKIRDHAVRSLQAYLLENAEGLSDLDFLKLWKGLYFCFWMSDKPLVQQELAQNLANTITTLPVDQALRYILSFWTILIKEWYRIDRLRLDKFYLLCRRFHHWTFRLLLANSWNEDILDQVMTIYKAGPLSVGTPGTPDSLRYHTSEVLMQELAKAMREEAAEALPMHAFEALSEPFFSVLSKSHNELHFNHVVDDFLGLWFPTGDDEDDETGDQDEAAKPDTILRACLPNQDLLNRLQSIVESPSTLQRNRRNLIQFNKRFAKAVGLAYTDPSLSVGVEASAASAAAAPPSKKLKKNKKLVAVSLDSADNVFDTVDAQWTGDGSESADDLAKEAAGDSTGAEEAMEVQGDISNPAEDAAGATSAAAKKRKRKNKKNAAKTDEAAPAAVEPNNASSEAEPADDAVPDETPSPKKAKTERPESGAVNSPQSAEESAMDSSSERKSVRWGDKLRVKTFFKVKPVCPPDQAKTPPSGTAAKPALRKSPAKAWDAEITDPERIAASEMLAAMAAEIHQRKSIKKKGGRVLVRKR
ncbi:hypothetical protein HK105_203905 [Polyrhizophydium stewartii]|uniref:Nop52-domain-containing protein n=1 Tax=Polyrhizophydium stewartii TaxID=2732419 RepID=A0ABR4NAE3_9FUNG